MIYQGVLELVVRVDIRVDDGDPVEVDGMLSAVRDEIDRQTDRNYSGNEVCIGLVERVRVVRPVDLPEGDRRRFLEFDEDSPEPEVDDTAYDDPWSPTQD